MRHFISGYVFGIVLAAGLLVSTARSVSAVPMLYPDNGHSYDFVLFNSLGEKSWEQARVEAEGLGGYLATVTSAGEQAFLESIQQFSGAYWAGGNDVAVEGTWRWMTGPEAGTQFWSGFSGGSTTPPFHYANWLPGEPNSTGEDYLSWNRNSGGSGWNDVGITNPVMRGFIVEFDSDPNAGEDTDQDGVPDASDNCPDDANPDQDDLDTDGAGDACDEDDDGDGVPDTSDNCPIDANPEQLDFDLDGLGNACDGTFDGGVVVTAIEVLVMDMRQIIVGPPAPPGGNGMIAKLTGKGGVLRKVGTAVSAFNLGLIDSAAYLKALEDSLDKLSAFDSQLGAKIGNGQIPEVTQGADLQDLSGQVRSAIEFLILDALE